MATVIWNSVFKDKISGPSCLQREALSLSSCSPVKLLIEMAQALCCTSPASELVNAGLSPCHVTAGIPTQGPPPAYPLFSAPAFSRSHGARGWHHQCSLVASTASKVPEQRWALWGAQGQELKNTTLLVTVSYLAARWQEKCCCCCPPFCLNFNVLSPAHPLPGASGSFNWNGCDTEGQENGNGIFHLKTAELPFFRPHPKLVLSTSPQTSN